MLCIYCVEYRITYDTTPNGKKREATPIMLNNHQAPNSADRAIRQRIKKQKEYRFFSHTQKQVWLQAQLRPWLSGVQWKGDSCLDGLHRFLPSVAYAAVPIRAHGPAPRPNNLHDELFFSPQCLKKFRPTVYKLLSRMTFVGDNLLTPVSPFKHIHPWQNNPNFVFPTLVVDDVAFSVFQKCT